MEVRKIADEIFVIDNFFSKEECGYYMALSEGTGYEIATIETEKGPRIIEDVRNNDRVLHTDKELAVTLWERLAAYVPDRIGNSDAIGLNELFRFYKYKPGQKFKKHTDQSFIRNEEEASYYTFMIYLNGEFEGGETKFKDTTIKGETGMALIFLHSLEHEGAEVTTGIKYILRTDIMYRLKDE